MANEKRVITYDSTEGQPVGNFPKAQRVLTALVMDAQYGKDDSIMKTAVIVDGLAKKLQTAGITTKDGESVRYGGVMSGLNRSLGYGFLTKGKDNGSYASDIEVLVNEISLPDFGTRKDKEAVAVEVDISLFAEADYKKVRKALEETCREHC